MLLFDAEKIAGMDSTFRRNFMNTLSGPKPCWLMGSLNEHNQPNFGLFSNVVHLSAQPPCMGVVFRPLTVPRHSYHNLHTRGFVSLNLVTTSLLPQAHLFSANWPDDGSEIKHIGLETEWAPGNVTVPLAKKSPVQILVSPGESMILDVSKTVFQVLHIHWVRLHPELLSDDGLIDMPQADAIASLGLDAYLSVRAQARFVHAKPNTTLQTKPWFVLPDKNK
jgi:flavin reductase (DIM6/NTAB) family NADH-FMN oxidoreductase RutF